MRGHCRLRSVAVGVALGLLVRAGSATAATPLVLWAWERNEDLRFAAPDVGVALLAGTLTLSGEAAIPVPRRQPALVRADQALTGVVHVEIDRAHPPPWSDRQRARAAALVARLVADPRFATVQLDFEVRASQRHVLLDLLGDLRRALPGRRLSMTALASWCDTETWLGGVDVDEVVPMLFRMGKGGVALTRRLASGGDFRNPRCRAAIGVSADTPLPGLPGGRTFYLFNPQPWTAATLAELRARLLP